MSNWYSEAEILLLNSNYHDLVTFYEQKIENDPDNVDNYWYLGLAYLLVGQEDQAQTTWFLPMGLADEKDIELWTENLVNILDTEAIRQKNQKNYQLSWLIREHIQEIKPNLVNNLLHLIELDIILNTFTATFLQDRQILSILKTTPVGEIESNLLLTVLGKVIKISCDHKIELAEIALPHIIPPEDYLETLTPIILSLAYDDLQLESAINLIQLCLKIQPNNVYLLQHLYYFYSNTKNFTKALEIGHLLYDYATKISLAFLTFTKANILYTTINSGLWLNINKQVQEYKILLTKMIEEVDEVQDNLMKDTLLRLTYPLMYIQDNLPENRWFQNNIAKLVSKQYQPLNLIPRNHKNRPLKIGYIAHTLRRHSVGWLSRWLIKYHDQDNFSLYLYLLPQNDDDLTKFWFLDRIKQVKRFPANVDLFAQTINEDEIDILVDLDSVSFNVTYHLMALKPAPIQITWLGMDATGLPTVDYFIADPYVLPENAQEYYQEKIWRLPQTYLAVDGFEVGVPSLKRQDLDIPSDGITYFTGQTGMKRNPDTIRMQLKIIKEVANSYLLIKGIGEESAIKNLFGQLAKEEGISQDRLKFLDNVHCEEIHRANLQELADIVLDTYPYSGATTTLETLWLGIPIVTKVGQQWAARNSYAFMMNAGITEGIAGNDQEYIDWGIRLGKDEDLRAKIAWKLRQSKKTSPLWNAKQFTLEMEKTYRQMWEIYVNSSNN